MVDIVAMPPEEILETVGAVAASADGLTESAAISAVAGIDGTTQELAAPIAEFPESVIPLDDLAQVLPIAITLGIASVGAGVIARGGLSPAASIAFTNVRLIPCIASDAVQRIVPSFGGGTGSGTSGTSHQANGTSHRGRVVPSGRQSGGGMIDVIREGFDRSVGRVGPDEDGESLRDSRMLAQLGMVLGIVYLSFLTVWFWATRLRWNPRKLT